MKEFEENFLDEDEQQGAGIDIFATFKLLWEKKFKIVRITLCFMAFGLFLALFSPEKYTSECIFVPQMSQGLSSRYSSIASMMGLDVSLSSGGVDGQVNPRLYPLILENPNYLKDLMYTKVHVEKAVEPISLYDYYINPKEYQKFNLVGWLARYTVGLPRLLVGLVKKDKEPVIFDVDSPVLPASGKSAVEPVIRLTTDEDNVARVLYKSLKLDVDIKKGYLTLDAVMPEAQASTELCQSAYRILQDYVRDFKKDKSEANLSFISAELVESRKEYEDSQESLARFMDSNVGIDRATAKIQKIRLESDYELAKQMYSELSRQELSAKVKVNENTVAFTELAPPCVPLKRTSPKRAFMLFVWTVLGGIFACAYVIGKDKYTSWKNSQEVSAAA